MQSIYHNSSDVSAQLKGASDNHTIFFCKGFGASLTWGPIVSPTPLCGRVTSFLSCCVHRLVGVALTAPISMGHEEGLLLVER